MARDPEYGDPDWRGNAGEWLAPSAATPPPPEPFVIPPPPWAENYRGDDEPPPPPPDDDPEPPPPCAALRFPKPDWSEGVEPKASLNRYLAPKAKP